MEKGEFELAQILLFPILKLVLSQPLFLSFQFVIKFTESWFSKIIYLSKDLVFSR
jgi:hypothetical protein